MFTVDIHCLVRMWCLRSGECLKSYPLEKINGDDCFSARDKIQCVRIDPTFRFLVVAFQGGIIKIFNIFSGAVMFNKAADETLDIEQEVAEISFFSDQATHWFIATCWDSTVAFFGLPQN